MDNTTEAIPYQHEADAFDVNASIGRVRNAILDHLVLIAVTCLACLGLVLCYLKAFPPIYKAEVTVYGDPSEDSARSGYYQVWNIFRKDDLKSEPELITTRKVVTQVVQDLNLKFDDVYHPVLTQVGYLWTQSLPGRTWKRIKAWMFPPDPSDYQPTPEEIDRARTIEAFKESVALEPVGNTTVAKLSVKAPTFRAAEYANKLIDVYLNHRRELGSAEADGAYLSLKHELDRAGTELREIEKEKVEFDQKNGLTVEFERDKVLLGKWGEVRGSVAELEAQTAGISAALAVVQQHLKDEPAEIVNARTVQESHLRTMMQAREFELSNNVKALAERYRPDSPELEEARRLLTDTRSALAKEPGKTELSESRVMNPTYVSLRQQEQSLQSQLESNRATLAKKREEFAVLNRRMEALPAIFSQSHVLQRRREAAEARYKMLNDRFMMADVSRSSVMTAPASLRVVDYAQPPMRKAWPDLKILLPAAILVGLIFGIGLALIAEMFSKRVTRHRLAGRRDLPVYAVVGMRAVAGGREDATPPVAGERPPSALTRLRKTG
jgi:uncharacterized protein involved in exopolysaccharide biosynthesis